MNIFYRLGDKLFANITNACNCDCVFCIRKLTDGMNDNESLWLDREPALSEIRAAFDARRDIAEMEEIVFCGFGEPLTRPEDVVELTRHFKGAGCKVRINTNGLVRLMHPGFDISRLAVADRISISLNADDAAEYNRVTRPRYGEAAYHEMRRFAEEMTRFMPVTLSVVGVISRHRIENCREIAADIGANFRVR